MRSPSISIFAASRIGSSLIPSSSRKPSASVGARRELGDLLTRAPGGVGEQFLDMLIERRSAESFDQLSDPPLAQLVRRHLARRSPEVSCLARMLATKELEEVVIDHDRPLTSFTGGMMIPSW